MTNEEERERLKKGFLYISQAEELQEKARVLLSRDFVEKEAAENKIAIEKFADFVPRIEKGKYGLRTGGVDELNIVLNKNFLILAAWLSAMKTGEDITFHLPEKTGGELGDEIKVLAARYITALIEEELQGDFWSLEGGYHEILKIPPVFNKEEQDQQMEVLRQLQQAAQELLNTGELSDEQGAQYIKDIEAFKVKVQIEWKMVRGKVCGWKNLQIT